MTAAPARFTLTLTAWLLVTPTVLVVTSPLLTAEDGSRISPPGEWTPRPDPTLLTTQNLQREIAALKEIIATRLEASDKAILLLQAKVDRDPQIGVVSAQLTALRELLSERFKGMEIQFAGIDKQFVERDVRVETGSKSTETAINAALQAQKESVTAANLSFAEATRKAEVATKERLDQLTTLFQTETRALSGQLTAINKSLDDKIVTLNARLGLIEGSGVGIQRQRDTQESSNTLILAVVGGLVSLIGIGLAIILALRSPAHVVQDNGTRA